MSGIDLTYYEIYQSQRDWEDELYTVTTDRAEAIEKCRRFNDPLVARRNIAVQKEQERRDNILESWNKTIQDLEASPLTEEAREAILEKLKPTLPSPGKKLVEPYDEWDIESFELFYIEERTITFDPEFLREALKQHESPT